MRLQQLQVAGDHEQQVVEVVGDAAGELADGLHLLRLRQPALALSQGLLDMLAVADVVDHASEIAAAVGFEFADRQVQREGRAVLAPATHFSTDADDLLDAGPDVVGDVAIVLGAVGLRHEHLDVLADELRGAVPEQPFGGRVDVSIRPRSINGDDGRDGRLQDAPELRGLRRRRGRLDRLSAT